MYQIALSKSTEEVFFYSSDCGDTSESREREKHVTSPHKKIMQFFFSKYFWKVQFDPIDNQCDVIRAAFCDSRYVFLWRGCMIFLC